LSRLLRNGDSQIAGHPGTDGRTVYRHNSILISPLCALLAEIAGVTALPASQTQYLKHTSYQTEAASPCDRFALSPPELAWSSDKDCWRASRSRLVRDAPRRPGLHVSAL